MDFSSVLWYNYRRPKKVMAKIPLEELYDFTIKEGCKWIQKLILRWF